MVTERAVLAESSYLTTRLLQAFQGPESRDPDVWREKKLTVTCMNLGGCKVVSA